MRKSSTHQRMITGSSIRLLKKQYNKQMKGCLKYYTNSIKKQITMAKNAAPSIKAADTIMLERMSPAASG